MAYSRLNWLLLPVSLTVIYALMTLYVWVPLSQPVVVAKSGNAFVAYWEGEVIGFAAIRLLVTGLLSLLCFTIVPRRRWEPVLAGALIGLTISVLDRYSFNWINYRIGYPAALFLIPLMAGLLVILPFDLALRRGTRVASD